MPSEYPIDVMLLATDLDVARDFYGRKLGLEILLDNDQFVTFSCAGDSRLVVTKSSAGTADEATKASWRVDGLAAEVADLRSRGVEILDLPDLNTVDGIADVGFAFAAWFVDPHRNSIGSPRRSGKHASEIGVQIPPPTTKGLEDTSPMGPSL
jgi:catechol 2,3-dioxygenase-like lactoylglutathione lyase family enzyme